MACSRLALPECSLPLWEAWPGLCFFFVFHKAHFSCPVSHLLLCFKKPHATLLFLLQLFASRGYCCFIFSWDVGVVPQPKSAVTSCQVMLDKEMLMSVGYQAGSLQLKSLNFLSSTDYITSLDCMIGEIYCNCKGNQVFIQKFSPKKQNSASFHKRDRTFVSGTKVKWYTTHVSVVSKCWNFGK